MTDYDGSIHFRCEDDLVQVINEIAEQEDTSQSEIMRHITRTMLVSGGVIDPETQRELLDAKIAALESRRDSLSESSDTVHRLAEVDRQTSD